jgi:NADPH:quinone reductase-like Zn-dependent oxidoreductase
MVARVVATAHGGPEVLAVVDEDIGGPGPGEVLVEIRAAAANPIDYKLYSGAMGRDPGALPMRLGYEASGTVLEIGSGGEGPEGAIGVGDEVIAFRATGAYAERVVVPGRALVPKPPNGPFEEASGLMLTGGWSRSTAASYPLADAAAAHRELATGHSRGKIVLVPRAATGAAGLS